MMDVRTALRRWTPALMAVCATLSAQAGALYVTDVDRRIVDPSQNAYGVSVVKVDGNGTAYVADSWRHGPLLGGESGTFVRAPIAVSNGRIDVAGPFNHGYALDGSAAQASICLGSLCSAVSAASDGATDGLHNYTIAPSPGTAGSQAIWRADLDWGQGSLLFSLSMLGSGEVAHGITYDPTRGSLWVDAWSSTAGSGRMLELGLDGSLKSSFSRVGIGAAVLAMDYGDNSLWLMQYGDLPPGQNSILRFDQQGQLLSATAYGTDWPGRPIYGAEFELVSQALPEPEGLPLTLSALGAGWAVYRRRRAP